MTAIDFTLFLLNFQLFEFVEFFVVEFFVSFTGESMRTGDEIRWKFA